MLVEYGQTDSADVPPLRRYRVLATLLAETNGGAATLEVTTVISNRCYHDFTTNISITLKKLKQGANSFRAVVER